MTGIGCTCSAAPDAPHSITCMAIAAGQPHAMVGGDGDVFYPDDREDAAYFAEHHGARPLDPTAFEAVFGQDSLA